MNDQVLVSESLLIEPSGPLSGTVNLEGAKNAVLVTIASLILTSGKSTLRNVPASADVYSMIHLLRDLGAQVVFDDSEGILIADTSTIDRYQVSPEIMRKMRASFLVVGPLLARLGRAELALSGGCVLGERAIDQHIKFLEKMGARIETHGERIVANIAHSSGKLIGTRCVFAYPSVGATENILMAATGALGRTVIVNGALEPEVLDCIAVLKKMGAQIDIAPQGTIAIEGGPLLQPIEHAVMPDRLEAGTLLLASAVTGGSITIPDAPAYAMEVFLEKLSDMGHMISLGADGIGVSLAATATPRAVSFRTMPYPGFPTDLQAPMMTAQCFAQGTSTIYETVFNNRILPTVRELRKMGAQITADALSAQVMGGDALYGAHVIAPDIRAAAGLLIAGLAAQGITRLSGLHHLRRGYDCLERKLEQLGARITHLP